MADQAMAKQQAVAAVLEAIEQAQVFLFRQEQHILLQLAQVGRTTHLVRHLLFPQFRPLAAERVAALELLAQLKLADLVVVVEQASQIQFSQVRQETLHQHLHHKETLAAAPIQPTVEAVAAV